jgi:uncharacterized damage-inducible protein DinB
MAKQQENENVLISRIGDMLNSSFHGGAWYGPSVLEALKGLTPQEASFKPPTVHTIAELIYHMTSWRLFAIKRLQGDNQYLIDDEKKNFGSNPKVDSFELETLIMELSLSQDELLKELSKREDEFLDEIVPGSEYSFYTLIHGVIQHDIYHTGQIILIKKLAAAKGVKNEELDLDEDGLFGESYSEDY